MLHAFGSRGDGKWPFFGLTYVGGKMYGTTSSGGPYGCSCGIVYSIKMSGKEKTLYSFSYGSDGVAPNALINVKGTLYGTAGGGGSSGYGVFYSLSTTGEETVLYKFRSGSDGANPSGGLIDVNGTLYGTTAHGGTSCGSTGCETVYSMTTTGTENVLYSFTGGTDGAQPNSLLMGANGTLFGTTQKGGCPPGDGCGTIFALSQ